MKVTSILIFLFLSSFDDLEQKKAEEYTAKAAFIYNFTKFIDWPDTQNSAEFHVAILKECPIKTALIEIAETKRVNDKRIDISVIHSEEYPSNCQILFIPNTISSAEIEAAVKFYSGRQTLIISEQHGMLNRGSGINFLIENHKIKFEINKKIIEKSHINISSQLLKLAKKVQ